MMKFKEFRIKDIFNIKNSRPLHKVNLNSSTSIGTPYITRTKFSNGLEEVISGEFTGYKNPRNTITFGAESVHFFYQPFEYYTGNKMYYLYRNDGKEINESIALYLTTMIHTSLENTGYGYGIGLTGTRFKDRKIMLPVTNNGIPDWTYMEGYIQNKIKQVKAIYQLSKQHDIKDSRNLDEVEWKEYFIDEIIEVKSGVRLTKSDQEDGEIPFIGASDNNNGITEFINNTNSSTDSNVLGVNYNGSVGYAFYHPYNATFSDDVKRLSFKNGKNTKYTLLFLKNIIERQAKKYTYGYKFNGQRMKRQIIKLPTVLGEPDFEFMEQYMKRMENRVIKVMEK